jgi:hypothetical protein
VRGPRDRATRGRLQRFEVVLNCTTFRFLGLRRSFETSRLFNALFLAWRLFCAVVDALGVGLEGQRPAKSCGQL